MSYKYKETHEKYQKDVSNNLIYLCSNIPTKSILIHLNEKLKESEMQRLDKQLDRDADQTVNRRLLHILYTKDEFWITLSKALVFVNCKHIVKVLGWLDLIDDVTEPRNNDGNTVQKLESRVCTTNKRNIFDPPPEVPLNQDLGESFTEKIINIQRQKECVYNKQHLLNTATRSQHQTGVKDFCDMDINPNVRKNLPLRSNNDYQPLSDKLEYKVPLMPWKINSYTKEISETSQPKFPIMQPASTLHHQKPGKNISNQTGLAEMSVVPIEEVNSNFKQITQNTQGLLNPTFEAHEGNNVDAKEVVISQNDKNNSSHSNYKDVYVTSLHSSGSISASDEQTPLKPIDETEDDLQQNIPNFHNILSLSDQAIPFRHIQTCNDASRYSDVTFPKTVLNKAISDSGVADQSVVTEDDSFHGEDLAPDITTCNTQQNNWINNTTDDTDDPKICLDEVETPKMSKNSNNYVIFKSSDTSLTTATDHTQKSLPQAGQISSSHSQLNDMAKIGNPSLAVSTDHCSQAKEVVEQKDVLEITSQIVCKNHSDTESVPGCVPNEDLDLDSGVRQTGPAHDDTDDELQEASGHIGKEITTSQETSEAVELSTSDLKDQIYDNNAAIEDAACSMSQMDIPEPAVSADINSNTEYRSNNITTENGIPSNNHRSLSSFERIMETLGSWYDLLHG